MTNSKLERELVKLDKKVQSLEKAIFGLTVLLVLFLRLSNLRKGMR